MRKVDFFEQLYIRALPNPKACSRPLSHAIDGKYGCFLKRRAEEGAGSMGEMMPAEENLGRQDTKAVLDEVLDPQFLLEPGDHRLTEDAMGARKGLHAGQ